MIFALAILAVLLIGWLVPAALVRPGQGAAKAVIAVALAWGLGFAAVYACAYATAALGGTDLKDEVEKAVNAWKLILLVAPASALHHRRKAKS